MIVCKKINLALLTLIAFLANTSSDLFCANESTLQRCLKSEYLPYVSAPLEVGLAVEGAALLQKTLEPVLGNSKAKALSLCALVGGSTLLSYAIIDRLDHLQVKSRGAEYAKSAASLVVVGGEENEKGELCYRLFNGRDGCVEGRTFNEDHALSILQYNRAKDEPETDGQGRVTRKSPKIEDYVKDEELRTEYSQREETHKEARNRFMGPSAHFFGIPVSIRVTTFFGLFGGEDKLFLGGLLGLLHCAAAVLHSATSDSRRIDFSKAWGKEVMQDKIRTEQEMKDWLDRCKQ